MGFKSRFKKSKPSGTKLTRGINIPPQPTVPKMPSVQSPKKNDSSTNR